ncbi:class I SAM-dependent DNA methyltransferase [Spirosoma sp. RP8]|uniref:site-specific DNA-methyltransferase (adenine-specific) n=1 Tax=Spirosoma liriopis TaxID=2937440 RepID=A0ABT0HSK2_9BACT|nr:DNA methyltransferase [Spirosoma liriopis]MCK8494618.1 class I SAM-dependent DNA methyltransferase [Spirosoma liriopis]
METSKGYSSIGRIDLYKRGCFVLETKQGTQTPDQQKAAERAELGLPPEKRRKGHAVRGTAKWGQMMQTARQQALGYVRALPADEPRPLFVLVADVGYCIDVYSNFAGVGDQFVPFPDQTRFRIPLAKLADPETRETLRLIFTDPRQLDLSRHAARVTRQLAEYLAKLSTQLERAGHAPDLVAQFLMRCLFTMFSEDVGLIPEESFTGMLQQYAHPDFQEYLPDALQSLWRIMDTGGFSPDLKARVRKFNGKLFHDARAFPLSADQIDLLLKAAKADWKAVEPAIFGTLLERALDPRERHSLGAHYTPRRYVERLVLPTVLEPLRREWVAAQAAAAQLLNEGKDKNARAELERFLRRLTSIKILDPACGSGNFLYVTLEHLKRLEGEVLAAINSFGQTALLNLSGGTTISPRQLLGLELNPRAAAIADVVLKIGYLQWHLRTHGMSELPEPLLDEYENIHQQDAVLTYDEGLTNPSPTQWPEANFIIGNPPFVGDKAMRGALGDAYVDALRKAYKGVVPESADLVMYWWEKAAETLRQNRTEAFGFITTNSITQTFNRRVIQKYLDADPALALTFAIADHPWVDSAHGAAVRIAMSVARTGPQSGKLLIVSREMATDTDDAYEVELTEVDGFINADLTIGADVTSTKTLKANTGITSNGMMLAGSGFIITEEQAKQLGLGSKPGYETRIRPYRNGKDLTARPRGVFLIDLFGLEESDVISQFPELYQQVYTHVKPERDISRDKSFKENWWLFGRSRSDLRNALAGLSRFIATAETSKHRMFQFLDTAITPDHMLVNIAIDDAFYLGVLSSKIHEVWALATGGDLGGNTPRYNSSRCFQTFSFPDATSEQKARIRELAEYLDAHRKRQQTLYSTLTITDLYNVVEKLRAGEALTLKEHTISQQGLASVVLSLHQQIDVAVADAYGWPHDLLDSEILTRLVALNHQRASEEAAGYVRYLRPSYQAPNQQQLGINLKSAVSTTKSTPSSIDSRQEWPKELAQQMQVVRDTVQQASTPLNTKQIAVFFKRTKPEKVQPLLDTLTALALVRQTPEGAYAM